MRWSAKRQLKPGFLTWIRENFGKLILMPTKHQREPYELQSHFKCENGCVCVCLCCWTEPKSAEQRVGPTTNEQPSNHYPPADQPDQLTQIGLLSKWILNTQVLHGLSSVVWPEMPPIIQSGQEKKKGKTSPAFKKSSRSSHLNNKSRQSRESGSAGNRFDKPNLQMIISKVKLCENLFCAQHQKQQQQNVCVGELWICAVLFWPMAKQRAQMEIWWKLWKKYCWCPATRFKPFEPGLKDLERQIFHPFKHQSDNERSALNCQLLVINYLTPAPHLPTKQQPTPLRYLWNILYIGTTHENDWF